MVGEITYPKSPAFIIPANSCGIMNSRIQRKVVKEGWKKIEKEAKKEAQKKEYLPGDFFITDAGRLKRRGTKKIFHLVTKKLPSEFISINVISKGLSRILAKAIGDKLSSISLCGIGIENGELEKEAVARVIVETCRKYCNNLEIKIIDEDEEFINYVEDILKNK